MNHLTHDQLSAYIDGALPAAGHAAADAHLAGCEACRAELETLRAADALFGEVLTHDPGDAYFATFAARVRERIGAEGAAQPAVAAAEPAGEALGADVIEARPQRAGTPWWDIGSWFTMPQRLAWVGGVAAVVVVAGVTIMMMREKGVPDLRKAQVLERSAQLESRTSGQAPPAATMQAPEADADAQMRANEAAAPEAGATGSDDAARGATPTGVRQMRRTPGGEDVPVGGREIPGFARAPEPAPPAETQPGEPITVRRPQRAEPLAATATEQTEAAKDEAPATGDARTDAQAAKRAATNLGATGAAEGESLAGRLMLGTVSGACGTVVDAQGRPLARAQVVLGDRGVTATTGADGRFCFDVGPGAYDLTVLAVGFTPLRQRVTLGDPNAPVRLVARTVDVLPAPQAPAPASSLPPASAFRDGLPSAPAAPAGLSDALRPQWEEAGRLMTEARRERSASGYEAAAGAWREVVLRIPDEAIRLDARGHLADALYAAWELGPTGARATAAAAALREVIERAPDGARKDRARRMLARLQP